MMATVFIPGMLAPSEGGVEQEFAITFSPQNGRFNHFHGCSLQFSQSQLYLLNGGRLHLRVANDASLTDLTAASFKLRLYQDNKLHSSLFIGCRRAPHRGEDECSRDKGDVDGHQAGPLLADIASLEIPRVGALQQLDPGILPQAGV